jgi:hypothetical protein
MGRMAASPALAERALLVALRPWTRRLAAESVLRWLVRGAIVALAAAALILAIGWLTPLAASDLRPIAFNLAAPLVIVGLLLGLWPATRLRRAAELDTRLGLADRLATAWLNRDAISPMAQLQRHDALDLLVRRSPQAELPFVVRRRELGALIGLLVVVGFLLVVPSPMEAVLRQIAADQLATQRAAERLDALRQDPTLAETLTPEQARRLEELLLRARLELGQARSQRDAVAALTRAEQQIGQLGDPSADAREQAIEAMSETLTQEPLTRRLGDALQRSDAQAAAEALQALRQNGDSLSEAQRQALAKALQRAANVGRADARGSAALREAARAVAAGESADSQLQEAASSIEEAMQAAAAEAALRSTTQRVQDMRTALTTGTPPGEPAPEEGYDPRNGQYALMPGMPSGTAVPIDAALARRGATTPGEGQSDAGPGGERLRMGGVGISEFGAGQAAPDAEPSESIFIPGRVGDGPTDNNDAIPQPFSIRGAPRPYREVLGQYAQNGRDYVDRAAVSPTVRELVRQYFAELEGQ